MLETNRSGVNGEVDTEGMKEDRALHKKERFDSYSGNLIHGGNRQNSRQREKRLEAWLLKNRIPRNYRPPP